MIMKSSRFTGILVFMAGIAMLSSCARPLSVEHTEIALGTYVKTIVVTEKQNRVNAQTTIEQLYKQLHTFEGVFDYRNEHGELNRFNKGEILLRSDHEALFNLILESIEYAELTGGFFDPSILPLMRIWGFDTNSPHVPDPEVIAETVVLVDYTRLSIDNERISKPAAVELDLSGIAKGKIVDIACGILRNAGFTDFLVDAGGDIFVSGRNLDRKKWRVAIQDPQHRDKYSGILEKSDCAVVTSGNYENFFTAEGKRYSHLLNPFTGYPDSDILSVTIIAEEAAFGDAVATAVFTMGSSAGYGFLIDSGIEGYIIYGEQQQTLNTPRFWD